MTDDSTSARGLRGETQAVQFLRGLGYRIVKRNFRCKLGELDIVCKDRHTLVFVEVRTRHDGHHGSALATVTRTKQRQIARVAGAYLSIVRPKFESCRFDVIGITAGRLSHVMDAFRPGL